MVRPRRDDLRVPLTELERTRRYDAGKKIDGRKRHIAVDATGLLLTVLITAGRGPRTATPPSRCYGI